MKEGEIITYNEDNYKVNTIDAKNNTTHLIDKEGNGVAVNTDELIKTLQLNIK